MEIAPAGDRALLIQLGDVTAAELHAYAASAREQDGVLAVIPGHSSLYVIFERAEVARAARAPSRRPPGRRPDGEPAVRSTKVAFDGADLGEFLAHTHQSREQFLSRVDGLTLTARYLGFRGGFAYYDGWPAAWAMPRRPTSRPVPRGSFAIAGSVAGFYPIDSPGGWNLLGRTDASLEHAIEPGDEIVIAVVDRVDAPKPSPKRALHLDFADILAAPLATLVRPADWSGITRGIPPGGPFDEPAAHFANAAVGNAPGTPLLECAIAGPRLRFRRDGFVAWGRRVRQVRAGEEVAFGKVEEGLRAYLAFGLECGDFRRRFPLQDQVIHAMRGPHDIGVEEIECEVTPQLDRVGIRLKPLRPIDAKIPADLKSIGMQCGTVQLHPDGSLVAMGPDHPVTGGYLQPMTVLWEERWKLAQLVPGERVRFVCQPPY